MFKSTPLAGFTPPIVAVTGAMTPYLRNGASFVWKVLYPHLVQCGPDQIAIGLEESRWNPRKRGVESFRPTLQHSGVLHGVLSCNDVRNTRAVNDGFLIECEQRCAELRANSLIQAGPP